MRLVVDGATLTAACLTLHNCAPGPWFEGLRQPGSVYSCHATGSHARYAIIFEGGIPPDAAGMVLLVTRKTTTKFPTDASTRHTLSAQHMSQADNVSQMCQGTAGLRAALRMSEIGLAELWLADTL